MIRKRLILLFVVAALGLLIRAKLIQAAPPQSFQTTALVASGINGPTGLGIAPDGRVFILERTGKVLIYKNGSLLAQSFVELPSAATGDRGLTGIAFDPDFDTNHWVYFYHTGLDLINRVVRFDALTDIAQNQQIIYQTSSLSFELHIGGTIAFGPDNKLYVSIGDNGNSINAQDLSNPHGKILRLNKDGSIPSDNPFVGQAGVREEIWAYGFRNPFRFQFDSITGRLYVGDVGDATWEEVNLAQAGKNYGWPTCEGPCGNPEFVDPIYAYPHNGQSSAVVAGPIYQGSMFPQSYPGKLFIGDYAQGFIKTLAFNSDGSLNTVEDFDLNVGSVVDLKQAPDGSIYYVTYIPARLYRVSYSETSSLPVANATADVTKGIEPLAVNFSSTGSYDPDGDPLEFLWDFGDGTSLAEPNPIKTYTQKGTYIVILEVSDGENQVQAVPIIIQVGIPPTVTIGSPSDNSTYTAGDTIFYSASAVDGAGFDIPDGNYTTEVIFHHDTHIHPFLGPIEGRSGEFTIPTSGEPDPNVWYEIYVTATDSNGLSSTKSVNIFPIHANITLNTNPAGLNVLLNGAPTTTNYTFQSVVGYEHLLGVPLLQTIGSTVYQFHNWSDSGKSAHLYQTPQSDSSVTAVFEPVSGFLAEYYDNMALVGEPVFVRNEQQVGNSWGLGSPDAAVPVDQFSARFSSSQYFAEGRYIFSTITDDGTRLFIDGELIINEWHDQSATRHDTLVYLNEGVHQIRMDYFENGVDALASLEYTLALDQSVGQPLGSFKAEYWNNDFDADADFSNYSNVWFNWQDVSPDQTINADNFVARFTKTTLLTAGTYKFSVLADDGVRIFVDGNLILDKWVDQPPTDYQVEVALAEGQHTIIVEYYEKTGGAVLEFAYGKIDNLAPPPSADNGLFAEIFDDLGFKGTKIERVDQTVDFNWGLGSPDPLIAPDTFSIRWSGKLQTDFSQDYTFYTTSDDGIRLWVNGQKIIDKWVDQPPTQWASSPIPLQAGIKYDIVLEFYEKGGGAGARLFWQSPTVAKQIIPAQNLFNESVNPLPIEGYEGQYWQYDPQEGPVFPTSVPVLTRIDESVYFNWQQGSPAQSLPADYFIARWTKQQNFDEGVYELKVTADDGVRVYLDNQIVLDKWVDQPPTTYTIQVPIALGTHEIKIEYYEKTGGAVCEISLTKI